MATKSGNEVQSDDAGGGRPRRRFNNPRWQDQGDDWANTAVEQQRGRLGAPGAEEAAAGMGGGEPQAESPAGQGARRGGHGGPLQGKKQINVGGRDMVVDGDWFVDKAVVDDYARRGIDLLNDPNPTPDMIAAVENNRMERSQAANALTAARHKAYNDRAWTPVAQQYGYNTWQQARNAMWQKAKERQAAGQYDDSKMMDLWVGGPALWAEEGLIGNQGGAADTAPAAPAAAPVNTNRPLGGATQVINGITYTQRPDGTWVAGGPAAPPATPPMPPTAAPPTGMDPAQAAPVGGQQFTRPKQTVGGMSDTLRMPPTQAPPIQAPKNPMQTSVSSYLQTPKPGNFGSSSQFKLPSLKPMGSAIPGMPKMPGQGGKVGNF